jgi:glycine cleavage system pyridoxal-binding protein P
MKHQKHGEPDPGSFQSRHIGPSASEGDQMLAAIGVSSMDELIEQTIPPGIRFADTLDLPPTSAWATTTAPCPP